MGRRMDDECWMDDKWVGGYMTGWLGVCLGG